uniref:DUF3444 domain-containing protein n=1 Tax=Cajanus cajan TaxID=3821 RepID=A0A151THA7_CAJCA|nr:hypothetical protein KK1_012729 [Cajanus cajan]
MSRSRRLKEIDKKKNEVKGKVGSEKGSNVVGNEKEGKLRKRMRSVGEVLERSKPSKRAKTGEEMMTLAEFQNEVKRKKLKEKEKEREELEEEDRIEKRNNRAERRRRMKNNGGLEVGEERGLKKSVEIAIEEKRKGLGIEKHKGCSGGELENMAVVDSDFYDFDKDRVERSFKKGQVWAVYEDDDGMARQYVLIDETVSVNPFEVKISWLDVQSSGDGKIAINIFSHVVDCDRAAREVYKIYPKKGSVWALYGEESIDADGRNAENAGKRCYEIVVFLTSYSEVNGLSMAYLEKVDGYKTVFKRQEKGCSAVRFLGKDDMWLVSHQIPARKLLCDETPELLKDCWELDPASLPSDLLTIDGIDN